mmetsp:Transcript_107313/g.213032  ORF Transcript_107313/g.213032 Transcript_107313/m.213032 type:complete len:268 (+) Transcript_107313:62-865(+)|eukprot:CAMPEP_0172681636 /NCGR_PEP_ID=MMETSP1074-20121228/17598_1 /TAXON_ID=2916 /ORGANISM="Ceratium fusus, Strain PA161109" /LENGTH=267 /DNA_ID=CAMNT_0013500171 /DNA_START=62 /DNA_END=865 /DNA_ORIENTATION=-
MLANWYDIVKRYDQEPNQVLGNWEFPGVDWDDYKQWIDKERVFYVWVNRRGLLDHYSLGLQYITATAVENEHGQTVTPGARFLQAEVLLEPSKDQRLLTLKYTGPGKQKPPDKFQPLDPPEITKQACFKFKGTIKDVKALIKFEFNEFGRYQLATNNCQHFVKRVVRQLWHRFPHDDAHRWLPRRLLLPREYAFLGTMRAVRADCASVEIPELKQDLKDDALALKQYFKDKGAPISYTVLRTDERPEENADQAAASSSHTVREVASS